MWAIDLPGFGGSIDVPPLGGPAELAGVVAEVIEQFDAAPAVVFGVSMGGDVALNVALEYPQAVSALVLISPGGLVPVLRNRLVQAGAWAMARLPDFLLIPLSRFANRYADRAMKAVVKDPSVLPQQVVEEFVRQARDPRGGLAYGRYNQATLGPSRMLNDLTGRVHEIRVPTLFYHGEDDPMVDPAGSQRAAAPPTVTTCPHWTSGVPRRR